jgi:murein tripeptide amidase MpaA
MVAIHAPMDNGNIELISSDDNETIRLKIRGDKNRLDLFQWFNFYLGGVVGENHTVYIENAGGAQFPGWNEYDEPYQAYASYDGDNWFNVETRFDEKTGKLILSNLVLQEEEMQIAFFPPYSYQRHLSLIESARSCEHCKVTTLGTTNGDDARDITLLTFGVPSKQKKEIWLIARQHPGEPQAEWYAEGLIEELKQANARLFERYTFRVVPNMNPDGSYFGNLRTNKEGKDLNRMWQSASIETSPEVYFVLEKMKEVGVDFFLDIHSDENIPRPFLDEAHLRCKDSNKRLEKQENDFMSLYIALNEEMQNELNYGEKDRTDPENMTIAAAAVGDKFNCPAFTLEMPTKQWSISQCKTLAKDYFRVLEAFYASSKQPNINSTLEAKWKSCEEYMSDEKPVGIEEINGWKALSLLSDYAAFAKKIPCLGARFAWGGTFFRAIGYGSKYSAQVEEAIRGYYLESHLYRVDSEHHKLVSVLQKVHQVVGTEVSETDMLSQILTLIHQKTGLDYFKLNAQPNVEMRAATNS